MIGVARHQHGGSFLRLAWDPRISILDSSTINTKTRVSSCFNEIGSLTKQFFKGLIELLQYRVALLSSRVQEASYVRTLPDHALSRGYFTSSRVVWDPGIIFSFSLAQSMERQVVMALLEDKQSLGREDCNVPILGFPCSTIRGNLVSLCQPGHRSKVRLTMSSSNLEELYGAQASPFAILHHQDHFHIVRSWFHGVPTISLILVIIGYNLIKYTKCVIETILSKGIHECNSSLEPGRKDLKVGMMRKGSSTSGNVLEAN
jgi:hypothetical protein